eukprot:COSAG05_NODE_3487_length_2031_cov_1.538820_2_plen_102_part_00
MRERAITEYCKGGPGYKVEEIAKRAGVTGTVHPLLDCRVNSYGPTDLSVCVCVFVCVCRADFVHMGRHMAEDRIVQAGTSQLHKEQVLSSSNHSVPVISVC